MTLLGEGASQVKLASLWCTFSPMQEIQGVIGHDWAVQRLQQAIVNGQLAQSHLFVGPPSIGKATLALATAQMVLAHGASDPQRAARLVMQRRHPDLTWVAPENAGDAIKVDVVRELLRSLSLAPVEGRYRVAVIDDAHLMSDSSKNAILKTLEEPNPSVVLILIAPSVDTVLPTISSRCQVLNLRSAPIAALVTALQARNIASDKATFVARLARGRVGWALRAIADDDLLETRNQQLTDLQSMIGANRTTRFAYAEKMAKQDSSVLQEILQEWLLLWRDVVQRMESHSDVPMARSIDFLALIDRLAAMVPLSTAHNTLVAITQTMKLLSQNVNPRLALDVLLLKMPYLPF